MLENRNKMANLALILIREHREHCVDNGYREHNQPAISLTSPEVLNRHTHTHGSVTGI